MNTNVLLINRRTRNFKLARYLILKESAGLTKTISPFLMLSPFQHVGKSKLTDQMYTQTVSFILIKDRYFFFFFWAIGNVLNKGDLFILRVD